MHRLACRKDSWTLITVCARVNLRRGQPKLDDRFHETSQLHLRLSIPRMRPFRASHMIRTLETLG
jgi:hypothetical protein